MSSSGTFTIPTAPATVENPDGSVEGDGTLASSSYGMEYLFQGGRIDPATGLYLFGARDYDPTTGRWDEQDPAGYINGASRYQMELSEPTSLLDPSGLSVLAEIFAPVETGGEILIGSGETAVLASAAAGAAIGYGIGTLVAEPSITGQMTAPLRSPTPPSPQPATQPSPTTQPSNQQQPQPQPAPPAPKPVSPPPPTTNRSPSGQQQDPTSQANDDGSGKKADNPKPPTPAPLKGREAATAAKALGYPNRIPPQKAPFNTHGQPAFSNGKGYITPDVDSHIGGVWKQFDRNGNRIGTLDGDGNVIGP